MPLYIGSFSFSSEATEPVDGRFEIAIQIQTLHKAEKVFREKIKRYFIGESRMLPVCVYLLDIIEIKDTAQPTMMLLEKESRTGERKHIFFSPLPMREKQAESWTASMPGDRELFLEIE